MPEYAFLVTALTNLTEFEFNQQVSFMRNIGQFVEDYLNIETRFALDDSDPMLEKLPFKKRPKVCYEIDKKLVKEAKFLIAEASYPSTGLGQELEVAASHKIPVILMYKLSEDRLCESKKYTDKKGEKHLLEVGNRVVSVMVQGNPSIQCEIVYKTIDDAKLQLKQFFKNYSF